MPDYPCHQRLRPTRGRWRALGGACFLMVCFYGCKSPLDASSLKDEPLPSIANIQGPAERSLREKLRKEGKLTANDDPKQLQPIKGLEEYTAAEDLFKEGKLVEAQKAFEELARKYKHGPPKKGRKFLFFISKDYDDSKRSPVYEDILFMQGECEFEQKHYAKAHDHYAELYKQYPSTRHLTEVSNRLFTIARTWLGFPEMAEFTEIQQVSLDDPGKRLPAENPIEHKSSFPLKPNFTDKSRPAFDTEGNALVALRSIWMNDPTGPLADDALMLTASYYARKGKFLDADRTFATLREEYPNSPHVQPAFVLGSHMKLMSYQGAAYDGRRLDEAEQLKQSTLRMYPNLPERSRIEKELAQIEEAKAARYWETVQLYRSKRKPQAEAVYCRLLLEHFPKSSYAEKARELLKELGAEYEDGSWILVHIPPDESDAPQPSPEPPKSETKRPGLLPFWPRSPETDAEDDVPGEEEPGSTQPPPRRLPPPVASSEDQPVGRVTVEPANSADDEPTGKVRLLP